MSLAYAPSGTSNSVTRAYSGYAYNDPGSQAYVAQNPDRIDAKYFLEPTQSNLEGLWQAGGGLAVSQYSNELYSCDASLNVGDPVRLDYSGPDKTLLLGNASTFDDADIIGFCAEKPTSTTCYISHFYRGTTTGLQPGYWVFLQDDGSVGLYPGTYSVIIGHALSSTEYIACALPFPAMSGASGLSGYSGYSGKSGTSGTSGYSGYSGLSGISGFTGASGYSGYSGPSGFSGAFSGNSGFSGYSGLSGYSGYSGGFSGRSGYSGYSGVSGYSGYSGRSGYSGYSGLSGYSGYSGLDGSSGYSGYSGPSGFSGTSTSGYSGRSGYSGVSGIEGASGFSGTAGTGGTSGYSGKSGYSGYSGFSGVGISGISGYSGKSGVSGAVGSQGVSGTSGYSGPVGSQGTSGYSGFSGVGTSGTSGYSGKSGVSGYSAYSGFSGGSGYSGYSGSSGYSGFSGQYSGFSGTSGAVGPQGTSGYSGYSGQWIGTDTIQFVIDGGQYPIANGIKGTLWFDYAFTIQDWIVLADQDGSIELDVWKSTYAGFPPDATDSIVGTNNPKIVSAQKARAVSMAGWTTSVAAGSALTIYVVECSSITRCTLVLKIART